jgi:cytochrome P450
VIPPGWVEIRDYREALEVYRSTQIGANPGSPTDEKHFRGGTVIRLDGPPHRERRRVMNRLLRRDGHTWFREKALHPSVSRNIEALLSRRDHNGLIHADLVALGHRVNVELAATVAGVDGGDTDEGAITLLELNNAISAAATQTNLDLLYGMPREDVLPAALDALNMFEAAFFKPSLARRKELVKAVEEGRLAEADLPADVMTMVAAHSDPSWLDDSVAMREVLLVLRAAVGSSTQAMVWVVEDLRGWLDEHPGDRDSLTDSEFMAAAVNESLRFHPANPGFIRIALADVTLSTGRQIRQGEMIAINAAVAAHDQLVFGSDADRFNPHRQIATGAYPYGLAFASGPHMCFGLPLVMGNHGIDGSIVHVLTALYAAGMRPDPEQPPVVMPGIAQHRFETYPVLFGE